MATPATGGPTLLPAHRLRWAGYRTAIATSEPEPTVWLVGNRAPIRLSGRSVGPVAAALETSADVSEVMAAFAAAGRDPMTAYAALKRWVSLGYLDIVEGDSSHVQVSGPEPEAELVRDALALAGCNAGDSPSIGVLVTDDYLHLKDQSVGVGVETWLPLQLRGHRVLIGPVIGPAAGCLTCLDRRVRDRRSVDITVLSLAGQSGPPQLPMASNAPLIASALIMANIAIGDPEPIVTNHVISVDVTTLEREAHRVVQVPGCPECDPGGTSLVDSLSNGETAAGDVGGGLRTVDPDVTWRKRKHLVSDLVGLIPEVTLQEPAELRVFHSGPNPVVVEDTSLDELRASLRGSAGGKGTTEAASRAGALAEAIERRSMVWRGDETVIRAPFTDMDDAIHPNAIQLFSPTQLAHSDAHPEIFDTTAPRAGFHRVPMTFDVDTATDWVPLEPLGEAPPAYLAASLAWLGHPHSRGGGLRGCSNGVAAGNTREEAILQGMLELIERDAVALWWYPRAQRPAFDLASTHDPRISAAMAPLLHLGREVWVLDLTSDIGLPVAAAISAEAGGRRLLHGFGAHVDPILAIVRALTEVAQMEAAAARPWFDEEEPSLEQRWIREVTTSTDPWLAPHGSSDISHPSPTDGSLSGAIDLVTRRLEGAGLSAYWLDLTRRDLELPVVRTVVPGLRHFWNRFGPGRLYDVPQQLGWVPAGYSEADLNPRWVFI